MIETDKGLVEIQNLKSGDMILTNGGFLPLDKLVICDHDEIRDPENPEMMKYVKFPKNCFGPNVTNRDLHLSVWHQIIINDKYLVSQDFVGKHPGVEWVSMKSKNYNLLFKDLQRLKVHGVETISHSFETGYDQKLQQIVPYYSVFDSAFKVKNC